VGQRLSETIIPTQLREAHEQGLQRFNRTGIGRVINTTIEMPAIHRSGHELPVELTIWSVGEGNDRSFYAFVRDISERVQANEALRESRARKDALLVSLAEGVITTDIDGKISSVNPAMEHLFGWTEDEVRGRLYSDAYPAIDSRGLAIPTERRLLTRACELKQPVMSEGYGMLFATRDGRHVPVAVTAAPMVGEDGELLGAVEIVRDMSRESEVDRLKSSLVSTVSHELRTPLTMIQGFSELLLSRSFTQEQVRDAAQHIHTSAERLGRLIENLLSVSRIDSGRLTADLEPLELRSLVFEAVHPFAEQWKREIHLDVPEGIESVLADHDKLIQIITNLISNAIKYSPEGTPVELGARQLDGRVEIFVTDHGIGMTQQELEHVFDKFFRANRTDVQDVGGTGLGLYITKALIEMHGGDIEVTSRPNEGTTFRFSLRPANGTGYPATQKEEMSWQNS
jgi:PAS domain S-box-containing protein